MLNSMAKREMKELERVGKKVFPCSPHINVEFDLSVLKSKKKTSV